MENQDNEVRKIDLYVLIEDILRHARRMLLVGLIMTMVCAAGLTLVRRRSYRPFYEAYASFTVRVSNPLYGSVSGYNEKTATVMAETFPSILTSNLLQKRIMAELGISGVPAISVSATAQSSILTLTVRDSDPQRAYDVLNAVIKCYPDVSEFVVGSTVLVLLDESGVPTKPVATFNYRSNLIRGGAIGAGLWLVLLVLLAALKNTIHNEEELRQTLNTPCLGQVPSVKLSRKLPHPLVHHMKHNSGFAESIRLLRLRMEKEMAEGGKKVLLISSAIPGEGKTTIAANLALSLAQKGKRVLLVDCDLRNPSVIKTLSTDKNLLSDSNNLVDYMMGGKKLMEVIQPTDVEGLHVISGGEGGKSESSAHLSQERMARLIYAARNLYDYAILDTPPCSLLADAAELSELADVGLMVIRQDFAARHQIMDGIQRLSEGRMEVMGCVFNNVRKGHYGGYGYGGYSYGYGYGGYGYGYGYGYGSYGYGESKKDKKQKKQKKEK